MKFDRFLNGRGAAVVEQAGAAVENARQAPQGRCPPLSRTDARFRRTAVQSRTEIVQQQVGEDSNRTVRAWQGRKMAGGAARHRKEFGASRVLRSGGRRDGSQIGRDPAGYLVGYFRRS